MAFTKILGPGIATDTNVQVGILTATKFYGDGSNLTGVSGMGAATSASGYVADVFYTDTIGYVNETSTLSSPSTGPIMYTRYQDVEVSNNVDLIISDGNDFLINVFQLS